MLKPYIFKKLLINYVSIFRKKTTIRNYTIEEVIALYMSLCITIKEIP